VSVTAPEGFEAVGVASGIKSSGALDLALVVAAPGTIGAAVFTTNRAAAAPVTVSRNHLAAGPLVRAVVLNSGCANAGTGEPGIADANATVAAVAAEIGCATEEVLICSTGAIGPALPMDQLLFGITAAVPMLETGAEAGTRAATAIMTTDTIPKESRYRGGSFTVGGMAKGAGMVRPDMATMLVVLTTDAVAEPPELDQALRLAVDESFHALNIDGCPSTNDTVILLASAKSEVTPSLEELTEGIRRVCWDLTNQLAADAEGASRVVTMTVSGAADDTTARLAGRAITDSTLVRSAFFGGDPNWGRLFGALGATHIDFDPASFGVAYAGIDVAKDGVAVPHDRVALHELIADGDFEVAVTVGRGSGSATIITTDLTPDYVTFNAEYS